MKVLFFKTSDGLELYRLKITGTLCQLYKYSPEDEKSGISSYECYKYLLSDEIIEFIERHERVNIDDLDSIKEQVKMLRELKK